MALDTPDGELFETDGWFTRFMRARRNEAAALLMGGIGVFLLGAVLTYDPLDPSLNTATPSAPSNAFGAPGAYAADAALQWFGWGAAAFAVMLVAWGVIVLARGPRRRGPKLVMIRTVAGLMALVGLSTAAASLPVPATWPFAAGLGGAAGDVLHATVSSWMGALRLPGADVVTGLLGLCLAFVGLFGGYGVTPGDVADAIEELRRLFLRARQTARVLADRYISGLEAEVVRLQPVEERAALEDHAAAQAEAPRRKLLDALLPPPTEAAVHTAAFDAEAARMAAAVKEERQRERGAHHGDHHVAMPSSGSAFMLPPLDLLAEATPRQAHEDSEGLLDRSDELETVLMDFGVKGQVVNAHPGPVVTLFEFEPAPGVKSARIISLADDIARSMSAVSARVAVVPGRNVIGIELPNPRKEMVFLRSLLECKDYAAPKTALPMALGETIGGKPFITDLARMPHLLIAGTTGSGKSVGINAMILSLMFRLPPEQCRFIMIDPKMLELSVYDGCPHLLAPVVTDPKKALTALKWTVREMEQRYRKMSSLGVRNIAGFNRRVEEARRVGEPLERNLQVGYDQETGRPIFEKTIFDAEPMPYIVVVIDEMADLMLVAGKDIEGAVQRLAQMARAAGIHLITATQRPSVDVITGTIKANFPTRISFQVTSKIDSRTILGEQGAEQLLGQGDLLFMAPGGRIARLHGPFVSDEEVEDIAAFFKAQGDPEYLDAVTEEPEEETSDLLSALSGGGGEDVSDELYDEAVSIVTRDRKASTSYLQRRLKIGYNRAACLIERLEAEGVVSQANHAGRREILAPPPPPPPI